MTQTQKIKVKTKQKKVQNKNKTNAKLKETKKKKRTRISHQTNAITISDVQFVLNEIEEKTLDLKNLLKALALLGQNSKILLQIAAITKLIKNLKKDLNSIMNLKTEIVNQKLNGDFFDWNDFIESVKEKASKQHYLTKSDREKLDEFAKILQAPAFCNPLDYDAYLRWCIYSVNKKVKITSYIVAELRIREDEFKAGLQRTNRKINIINSALEVLNALNTETIITKTMDMIKNIRKITAKKKLTALDLDKINDIVMNIIYDLKIRID